jgi:hypothetical protein
MMSTRWLEPGEWTWTDTSGGSIDFSQAHRVGGDLALIRYTSRRKTFRERWLSTPWHPWVKYVRRRYDG